jgi:hypothetical protein
MQAQQTLSRREFNRLLEKYTDAIERNEEFSKEEYLEIGRLWNTVSFHAELRSTAEGEHFSELVRDKVLLKAVDALGMVVSRGYSFYSEEFDFFFGGTLDKRFRYAVEGLTDEGG